MLRKSREKGLTYKWYRNHPPRWLQRPTRRAPASGVERGEAGVGWGEVAEQEIAGGLGDGCREGEGRDGMR